MQSVPPFPHAVTSVPTTQVSVPLQQPVQLAVVHFGVPPPQPRIVKAAARTKRIFIIAKYDSSATLSRVPLQAAPSAADEDGRVDVAVDYRCERSALARP